MLLLVVPPLPVEAVFAGEDNDDDDGGGVATMFTLDVDCDDEGDDVDNDCPGRLLPLQLLLLPRLSLLLLLHEPTVV